MQTVTLEGVGEHPAIEAIDLKIGDIILFEFGIAAKVVGIKFSSHYGKENMTVTLLESDGSHHDRPYTAHQLVAVGRWNKK